VSHLKERKEKNCLNCQATLIGRYCHVCGQENLEPKETVWHLVLHFFNDITHFDGKFFSTVKYLMRKPGFLSREYIAGRRASYLNPIRMYVFTSAIFFIILFSLKSPEEMVHSTNTAQTSTAKGLPELEKKLATEEQSLARTNDEDEKEDLATGISHLKMRIGRIKKLYGDTTTRKFTYEEQTTLLIGAISDSLGQAGLSESARKKLARALHDADNPSAGSNLFGMNQGRFKTVAEYDSTEQALPDSLRDGWFKRALTIRLVAVQEQYARDKERFKERFLENMLHSFPKILFWSLPFFALILNILYFRHKKQFYYVDHGIFTIHVYCATFILLLATILLGVLTTWLHWTWFKVVDDLITFGIIIWMMIYLYKAMRGFYRQGRAKTFLKYLIAGTLAFTINLILLVIFLLISVITA
jgi:hypothetical protein